MAPPTLSLYCFKILVESQDHSTTRGYITRTIVNIPNKEGAKKVEYHVKFHSITHQNVPHKHVIIVGGATPWPELKTGSHVLARVKSKLPYTECYVPGVVVVEPFSANLQNRFYTIRLFSGHTITKQRSCIIKIGPDMYHAIIDYIASIRYRKSIAKKREQLLYRRKRLRSHSELLRQQLIQSPNAVPMVGPSRRERRSSASEVPKGRRYKCSNPDCTPTINYSTVSSNTYTPPSTPHSLSPRSTHSNDSRTSNDSKISKDSSIPKDSGSSSHTSVSTMPEVSPASSRRSLHSVRTKLLKEDAIVLAKWLDDGWFYFGRVATVPNVDEEEVYTVVDANDHREMINREDIFTDEEQMFEVVQPHDHVVGLHPDYVYSYAPGKVSEVYDQGVQVHFFDDAERRLPWSEIYKITSDKYNDSIRYIAERLNNMRGNVVARDDKTGKYRQYIAESTEVKTQQIELKLPETNFKIKQLAIHVFPMVSPTRHNEQSWRYVIAPIDSKCSTYLPAKVTNTKPFKLAYCDGTVYNGVTLNQCFYINEEYYKNATNYLLNQLKRK